MSFSDASYLDRQNPEGVLILPKLLSEGKTKRGSREIGKTAWNAAWSCH